MHADGAPPNADALADVAILGRIALRDAQALSELYDRHSRLLFTVISRIVRDRAHAEEVLQEVFLSIWTKAATYTPALGLPIGWLVRLARNRAIDQFRNAAVRARTADTFEPAAPDNPEQLASRNEERRRVRAALELLPREQRQLIEDAYFRGMTHSELAEAFGLPLGTVKTRVRAAMQALRRQLDTALIQ